MYVVLGIPLYVFVSNVSSHLVNIPKHMCIETGGEVPYTILHLDSDEQSPTDEADLKEGGEW